jgi:hypothetical protein
MGHMGPQNVQMMCPWMTQSDVQHMQKNPMMGWYAHMGQTRVYPDSPMSIVALQDEVSLSKDQIKQFLGTVTKSWNPRFQPQTGRWR